MSRHRTGLSPTNPRVLGPHQDLLRAYSLAGDISVDGQSHVRSPMRPAHGGAVGRHQAALVRR